MAKKTKHLLVIPEEIGLSMIPFLERVIQKTDWQIGTISISSALAGLLTRESGDLLNPSERHKLLKNRFIDLLDIYEDVEPDVAFVLNDPLMDESLEELDESTPGIDKAKLVLIFTEEFIDQDSMDEFSQFRNLVAVRPYYFGTEHELIELSPFPITDSESMERAIGFCSQLGFKVVQAQYGIERGPLHRALTPVVIDAFRMFREGLADFNTINMISKESLGMATGLIERLINLKIWAYPADMWAVENGTFVDSRFSNPYGKFTFGQMARTRLSEAPTQLDGPVTDASGMKVLLVGTPHLVSLWHDRLQQVSAGRIRTITLPIWNVDVLQEEDFKKIAQQGQFDLVMELLLGPSDDRHVLLDLMHPLVKKGGSVWVHTLNLPATITVQIVPEELCAVGFGGLPTFGERAVIELVRPRNSDASDLVRAAGLAKSIGFEPYEVADEPGGIGARLLAVAVNATSFLAREGLLASEAEADQAAKRIFWMEESPFTLADRVGLDSVEAVLLGLQALLGEERYRVCPLLTLRIESGVIGQGSGRGFYV